ncbi:MAG: hypothetical protein ACFWUA_05165 [Sporanaerobacter sp.]|jgi:uncharacterized C2H2 Zn-finger protein|uniref:hypothetical protein n=1 Tax=Sporanaerobacter sp. TaxID=2010183 RepID=UPI003A10335C
MNKQLIMNNRQVEEKFNRYKDTVISLTIWENQPIEVDSVYYCSIRNKELIQEIFKEIDVREIQRIYISEKEYDIHVNKKYLFKLIKGKNVKVFNSMY